VREREIGEGESAGAHKRQLASARDWDSGESIGAAAQARESKKAGVQERRGAGWQGVGEVEELDSECTGGK